MQVCAHPQWDQSPARGSRCCRPRPFWLLETKPGPKTCEWRLRFRGSVAKRCCCSVMSRRLQRVRMKSRRVYSARTMRCWQADRSSYSGRGEGPGGHAEKGVGGWVGVGRHDGRPQPLELMGPVKAPCHLSYVACQASSMHPNPICARPPRCKQKLAQAALPFVLAAPRPPGRAVPGPALGPQTLTL